MHLTHLKLQGCRNLVTTEMRMHPKLNIIFGLNGAGKSSVLEAVSILTSGRSFRTSKLDLVVSAQDEQFIVFGKGNNNTKIGLSYAKTTKQKSLKINGDKVTALSLLSKLYPTQVLSPESYHLIDSGPNERRKYLDWCLFHVEHSYHDIWKGYQSVIKQRNALLRSKNLQWVSEQISVWDSKLIEYENKLTAARERVLVKLESQLETIVVELGVTFFNNFKLSYYPGYTGNFAEKLKESFQQDFDSCFTRIGPHKADIRIKVDNYLAKDYLSRGQKKVAINALFLAQTLLLKQATQKDSLFIIDDFTSELDDNNQHELLEMLLAQENVQILLSCLQVDSLKWLKKRYNTANVFHVEHGEINQIDSTEPD
ncbi:DNA replication/repair protein RecF [Aliikangiella sp. IMCC44632]